MLDCPPFTYESGARTRQVRNNPLESGAGRGTRRDRDGCRAMESLCEQVLACPALRVRPASGTHPKTLRISRRRSSRGYWKKETCHARHPHGVASGRPPRIAAELSAQRTRPDAHAQARRPMHITSIDMGDAEERLVSEPATADTADDHFHRRWALMLLDRGLDQTKLEYERAGKATSSRAWWA